ncbi:RNA polymerase sigma factor [Roseibium sp. RKSG952]|uniref:RNA polymerase sigma factor n=1 Tax=Roseibium sp. RKSG952 TaxID=2529384 RepID=UPI0012BBF38E|nr:RNA polymerase sigma factor [Roseibium sp. RKSG952]MTH97472.1 RNA polymerase sigma factor [Roseibium sp. RKSG952]
MRPLKPVESIPPQSVHLEDLQLLACVAQGDLEAFEQFHRKYFPKLMQFARRVTGDNEAAEEVTNDAFMVVWRTADRFEGRSKASTWLFGIAYRLSLKKRQKLARHKEDICIEDCVISDGKDTAESIIRQRDLAEALGQLKPELRAVVELTYYNGYLYTEISDILGCPVGTVKTRMMTARKHLRRILSDEQFPFSETAVA